MLQNYNTQCPVLDGAVVLTVQFATTLSALYTAVLVIESTMEDNIINTWQHSFSSWKYNTQCPVLDVAVVLKVEFATIHCQQFILLYWQLKVPYAVFSVRCCNCINSRICNYVVSTPGCQLRTKKLQFILQYWAGENTVENNSFSSSKYSAQCWAWKEKYIVQCWPWKRKSYCSKKILKNNSLIWFCHSTWVRFSLLLYFIILLQLKLKQQYWIFSKRNA